MTNTVQEFKVGDQFIVTKQSFRDQGYTKVYTVSKVAGVVIYFRNHDGDEALVYSEEIEKYIPEPQKHKHHDLIIEWAKDPANVIVQYRGVEGDWRNTADNSPSWCPETEYRINPKTKQVIRWKWAFLSWDNHVMESGAYYTEEEALQQFENATPFKLEHTAITEIEEV